MLSKIKAFLKEETGAETLEYIAIAAVVIVLGATAYGTVGVQPLIQTGIDAISTAITGAG